MTAPKRNGKTASIDGRYFCTWCGWPVVVACCNDEMFTYAQENGEPESDWWMYCSNKGCSHHHPGEGYFQNTPFWVKQVTA